MTGTTASTTPPTSPEESILRQPKAVWAVAFACVIAFMGIGLVDPILPAIAGELDASQSQVMLLFTSYMAVTGVAMLVTGAVSSRIGPKRTLLAGLALIVVFSALAGASGTVNEIVGFRAGWGLGNALFIATALAVIVGAASGGVAGAIILYEAALGIGIATGPLLGGLLGGISWRGPFFGTAVLMAVGFVAISVLLPSGPPARRHSSVIEPLRALRHRGLLTMGLTALFYNFGFFTLLAYTPFPLGMDAHGLGLVFFGWGLALAITSVFAAPPLKHRFGTVPVIYAMLALIALDLLAMAVFTDTPSVLVGCVVVAGLFLGVNNTLVTEAVMRVSPVERPVASAGYSFVRFIGGALAPYLAGRLGEGINHHVPFYVGAAAVVVAMGVLTLGRRHLRSLGDDALPDQPAPGRGRVVLAVDSTPVAAEVTALAAASALERDLVVDVLHVHEVDVVGEEAIAVESEEDAAALVAVRVDQLRAAGVEATGTVVRSTGNHADLARRILDHAGRTGAAGIIVGHARRGTLAHLMSGDVVAELTAASDRPVAVIDTDAKRLTRVA